MSRSLISALSALALLAAGCTSGSPQPGAPTKHDIARTYSEQHGIPYYETDPYQEPYHPCVEIPDEVVQRSALTEFNGSQSDFSEVPPAGWRSCTWTGPAYDVTVATTLRTGDEIYANRNYSGFRRLTVNGRGALEFLPAESWIIQDQCSIAFDTPIGTAWIRASLNIPDSLPSGSTPCSLATAHAAEIEPYLPKQNQERIE